MEIHIHANNQQLGPFATERVLEMARTGAIPDDALVWHADAPEWYPLSDFIARHGVGSTPSRPIDRPVITPAPIADEPSANTYVLRGIGAGFATALVGGGLWIGVSLAAGIRIPYVGLVIGWLVGVATSKASREEAAPILPISAVVFTLFAHAFFIPYFLLSPWFWLSLAFACYNAWKASAN